MKLVYWVSECLRDSDCYNIRATTKKECVEMRTKWDSDQSYVDDNYGPVHKMVLEYQNGFELLDRCLSEGRVYEGEL